LIAFIAFIAFKYPQALRSAVSARSAVFREICFTQLLMPDLRTSRHGAMNRKSVPS